MVRILSIFAAMTCCHAADVLHVLVPARDGVFRFDAKSGALIDRVAEDELSGDRAVAACYFRGKGDKYEDLYVLSNSLREVHRYDGRTLAYKGIFTTVDEGISAGGMCFTEEGDLLVADKAGLFRFDREGKFLGKVETGYEIGPAFSGVASRERQIVGANPDWRQLFLWDLDGPEDQGGIRGWGRGPLSADFDGVSAVSADPSSGDWYIALQTAKSIRKLATPEVRAGGEVHFETLEEVPLERVPLGCAVGDDGEVFVSFLDDDKVVKLSSDGKVLKVLADPAMSSPSHLFVGPKP